jgi:hypothetical protein
MKLTDHGKAAILQRPLTGHPVKFFLEKMIDEGNGKYNMNSWSVDFIYLRYRRTRALTGTIRKIDFCN